MTQSIHEETIMPNYICPWCGAAMTPQNGRLWKNRGIVICNACRKHVNYRDDLTSPGEFDKLSPADRQKLLDWVRRRLEPTERPAPDMGSTYLVKHILKRETGLYVYTGALNGALLRLGFKPFSTANVNWIFSMRWKPTDCD